MRNLIKFLDLKGITEKYINEKKETTLNVVDSDWNLPTGNSIMFV